MKRISAVLTLRQSAGKTKKNLANSVLSAKVQVNRHLLCVQNQQITFIDVNFHSTT